MGLLDIWQDWRKETGYFKDSSSNLQTITQDSDTINRNKINRGRKIGISSNPMDNAINQSGHTPIGRQNVDKIYPDKSQIWKNPRLSNAKLQELKKVQNLNASKTPNLMKNDFNKQGGINESNTDPRWWHKLANMANVDFDKAMASWKDKGGFEGLMANPAFTMGLAFMQAGAEGKTLGQGALDNVMKAGGISQHYKKIIEDRKQKPITITSADVSDVKDLLQTMKVDKPNWFEKAVGFITKGDTGQAAYDQAAEQIASAVQVEIESMQRNHKGKKPFVIDIELKKKVIKKVLDSKKIKHKKSWTPWTSGTVQSESENPFKARGGPVQAGKPYIVGEEGPEIVIPHSDGNVLSNDDSQIYAMLLASNPQLQKVSRTRAEKILRSRFPEYFE